MAGKKWKRDEESRLQLYSLPHWWSQDLYLKTSSILLFRNDVCWKRNFKQSVKRCESLKCAKQSNCNCWKLPPHDALLCPVPQPSEWVSNSIPQPLQCIVTTNPYACLRKICKVTENCFQIFECECKIKSTLHRSVWVKCKAKNLPSHKRLFTE